MHRRRQNHDDAQDVPVLTDAIDADDDLPVLLDVEPSSPPQPALPLETISAESPDKRREELAFNAALRDILAHDLALRLEQRITAELPRIIESTVRDFLAEQEMIAALQSRD
jgi:hypothetical protein